MGETSTYSVVSSPKEPAQVAHPAHTSAGSGKLLADYLAVRPDDARTGRHFILHFVRRRGFIPPFQFLPIRCDEAQHGACIQTAEVDELESYAGRLDSDRVGVV